MGGAKCGQSAAPSRDGRLARTFHGRIVELSLAAVADRPTAARWPYRSELYLGLRRHGAAFPSRPPKAIAFELSNALELINRAAKAATCPRSPRTRAAVPSTTARCHRYLR